MVSFPLLFVYLVLGLIVILIAMMIYQVLSLQKEVKINREKSRKIEDLNFKIDEMKLEYYDAKLNPHLFKNILNSIQSNAYQTYYTIDKLASVLDYILYGSKAVYVTPKEELDFTLNFIEINRIKLSPLFDFQLKKNIKDDSAFYQTKLISPMITIDLIENAFKHTDFQKSNSFIKIVLELNDHFLHVSVKNTKSMKNSLSKENGGQGLGSLDHRLKMIYNECYELESSSSENYYFSDLRIDLKKFYAKMSVD